MYVTLKKFTPADLQNFYTDIFAISATLCNSASVKIGLMTKSTYFLFYGLPCVMWKCVLKIIVHA